MSPIIEGRIVTEGDIGKEVTFCYSNGDTMQHGLISSFRDEKIWVKFRGPNGERCEASLLKWGWQDV